MNLIEKSSNFRVYYSHPTLTEFWTLFWAETGKMLFHKSCRFRFSLLGDIKMKKNRGSYEKVMTKIRR